MPARLIARGIEDAGTQALLARDARASAAR